MFPPLRLRSALSLGGLHPRELAIRVWKRMVEHEITTRAAAVAFYAMLATVPFLALMLTILVQLLPDVTGWRKGMSSMTVHQLEESIRHLFPREVSGLVMDQIARIQAHPPVGLLSVGVVIALWLASSLYLAIIDAMNRVFGVTETRSLLRLRLAAILMTIVQATVLIGSLVVIVAWPQILRALGLGENRLVAALVTTVKLVGIYVMILLSFALTFYFAPDADQRWEWITPGSLMGSTLFILTSLAFRVYVQNWGNYDKTYGSLAGVMALLFWFWLMALILLTAAEVNKVIEAASPLGKPYGQRTDPAEAPDFQAMPPQPQAKS
ncbi:MAG TPA: YihY/virulence factor BrkB family protein [Isosphaeraceae bacterium]|jgi:membrane protein|nr:YihY/virulence factor BrkB family protein [Isosphaeraceae bacterium]